MKAIVCKKFAPVSDLVWEEVADPCLLYTSDAADE